MTKVQYTEKHKITWFGHLMRMAHIKASREGLEVLYSFSIGVMVNERVTMKTECREAERYVYLSHC